MSLINWDKGDTIYRQILRGSAGLEVKETISFLDLLSLRCHQETEIWEFPTIGAIEDIEGLQGEQKGRIIFTENYGMPFLKQSCFISIHSYYYNEVGVLIAIL